MKQLKIGIILFALLGLAGCETLLEITGYYVMDQAQCNSADWNRVGYEDGRHDAGQARFSKYQDACNRFQIHPNAEQYYGGYNRGYDVYVQEYCTFDNGYRKGRKGTSYKDICSGQARTDFLSGYDEGFGLFILSYCTPNNAFRLGKADENYRDICPGELKWTFQKYYKRGQKVYELEERLDDLEDAIDDKYDYLRFHEDHLTEQELFRVHRDIEELRDEKASVKHKLDLLDVIDIIDTY